MLKHHLNYKKGKHFNTTKKTYKESLVFLMANILKDITNLSPKASTGVSQCHIRFESNVSLYTNAFQYPGAIKVCKKFPSSIKKLKKNLIILQ